MTSNVIHDVMSTEHDRRYDVGLNSLVKISRERFVDTTIALLNLWTFINVNTEDDNNNKTLFLSCLE